MKLLSITAIALAYGLLFCSCVTSTTTTTAPDGTVVVTVIKGPDAATVGSVAQAATAIAIPLIDRRSGK